MELNKSLGGIEILDDEVAQLPLCLSTPSQKACRLSKTPYIPDISTRWRCMGKKHSGSFTTTEIFHDVHEIEG